MVMHRLRRVKIAGVCHGGWGKGPILSITRYFLTRPRKKMLGRRNIVFELNGHLKDMRIDLNQHLS
jgi:hypothetical protein